MCRVICQTPVMLQSRKESVSLAHAVSCKENQATIWRSKCFGAVEANALQDKKNKALPPPGSFQTFRSSGCDITNGVHAPVERPHSKLQWTLAPDISPGGLVMKLGGSGSRYSCHFFLIVSAYRHTFTLPNPPPLFSLLRLLPATYFILSQDSVSYTSAIHKGCIHTCSQSLSRVRFICFMHIVAAPCHRNGGKKNKQQFSLLFSEHSAIAK